MTFFCVSLHGLIPHLHNEGSTLEKHFLSEYFDFLTNAFTKDLGENHLMGSNTIQISCIDIVAATSINFTNTIIDFSISGNKIGFINDLFIECPTISSKYINRICRRGPPNI